MMDFEDAARRALPTAHFGYMESGVDDDLTVKANHEAYQHIELRTRRLIDVGHVETKVDLFGTTFDFPIFICPTGAQRMFNPDAELATARAAKSKNALQILSTVTSVSYEETRQSSGWPSLVSTLCARKMGTGRAHHQARRSGRMPGACADRRSARRTQHGNL